MWPKDLIVAEARNLGVPVLGLDVQTSTLDYRVEQLGDGRIVIRLALHELGVTPASELINLPGGSDVLIAGVRRATHTPPMRSGKRVVFLSLDDGSVPVSNVVFFHDAQAAIGAPVFHTHYVLIRGRTRRIGASGVSATGEGLWDLLDVAKTVRARQAREREEAQVVVEAEAADNVIQMWRRRA
ncbi:hypothetical protein GY21_07315 [Cryobacterium roopkundense]|uniref:DNA polymerase III alpha subunit n=1 Tax=Cryobacterium roopkundense TaxID=1001240 RepID=A0A099JIX7_9MICO|nr:hypothetical protein [Cryobacterium roopkundense]KGJ77577.1 hypothetical protein GY21_07315 [Cryobacterium roopkundense]MBB5641708.1 DNA polymerase III alpha subunit [Cryobacterium roopkundense]